MGDKLGLSTFMKLIVQLALSSIKNGSLYLQLIKVESK
mgnify:FL=1